MNRIVRDNYPVADLPEDLRPGGEGVVRVTVESVESGSPADVGTLDELWALRRPPFRSIEQIAEQLRRDRDAWDD